MLYTPICDVYLHTENDGTILLENVRSISANKTLSQAAGSFTVRQFDDVLIGIAKSMDVVEIRMGYNDGKPLNTVFLGFVDEVRHTERATNDIPLVETTFRGRDLAKFFINAVIKRFPRLADDVLAPLTGDSTLMGWIKLFRDNDIEMGTPDQFIKGLVDHLLFKIMDVSLQVNDNRLHLKDLLHYQLRSMDIMIPFVTSKYDFEGSMWNWMQSSINSPFHELFVDVRPADEMMMRNPRFQRSSSTFGEDTSRMGLFLRPTPFDRADWDRLPRYEAVPQEIHTFDLGNSDHEHYNVFRVVPEVDLFGERAVDAKIAPMINVDIARRYGLSMYESQFHGLPLAETDDLISLGKQLTLTAKRWFENAHLFEEGSYTLKGTGQPKIGQRLLDVKRGMEYYIEGVTQQYNVTNRDVTWKTDLSVTRGQKPRA